MSNLPVVKSERQRALTGEVVQLVSFRVAGEEYGINVLSVREIIRLPNITSMPNAPADLDGIITLRGAVVPIISLRRHFALNDQEKDRDSRILVMEINSQLIGFVVDAVAEVIRVAAVEIQPPPSMVQSGAAGDSIVGVLNQAERLLIVIDLERRFAESLPHAA